MAIGVSLGYMQQLALALSLECLLCLCTTEYINPYSADFFVVRFDISFCLGISRKGSIKLFDLFHFFLKQGAKSKTSHLWAPAARGPIDI